MLTVRRLSLGLGRRRSLSLLSLSLSLLSLGLRLWFRLGLSFSRLDSSLVLSCLGYGAALDNREDAEKGWGLG